MFFSKRKKNEIVPESKSIINNSNEVEESDNLAVVEVQQLQNADFASSRKIKKLNNPMVIGSCSRFVRAAYDLGVTASAGGVVSGLYKCTVPKGANLVPAKDGTGFLGMCKVKGQNGIVGQARFNEAGGAIKGQQVLSNAMSLASLAVGEYYMSEITDQLEDIKKGIDEIIDLHKSELTGKISSIFSVIKKSSDFLSEILSNEDNIRYELNEISDTKRRCMEVLGEIDDNLKNISLKTGLSYEDYIDAVGDAFYWYQLDNGVLEALKKISDLEWTLFRNTHSQEYCMAQFYDYYDRISVTMDKIKDWNTEYCKKYGIDLKLDRVKRTFWGRTVRLFMKNRNWKEFPEQVASCICSQLDGCTVSREIEEKIYFDDNVELLWNNGECYILEPEAGRKFDSVCNSFE